MCYHEINLNYYSEDTGRGENLYDADITVTKGAGCDYDILIETFCNPSINVMVLDGVGERFDAAWTGISVVLTNPERIIDSYEARVNPTTTTTTTDATNATDATDATDATAATDAAGTTTTAGTTAVDTAATTAATTADAQGVVLSTIFTTILLFLQF